MTGVISTWFESNDTVDLVPDSTHHLSNVPVILIVKYTK